MKRGLIVSRYYKEDKDVTEDVELQAYLNEVSLNGTGPNGGIGRVNMKTMYQAHGVHTYLICDQASLLFFRGGKKKHKRDAPDRRLILTVKNMSV